MLRTVTIVAIVAFLVTAVSVVWVRHEIRATYAELHSKYQVRDELNREWRRLLVEQAAFSAQIHLRNWAESNLEMHYPTAIHLLLPATDKSNS